MRLESKFKIRRNLRCFLGNNFRGRLLDRNGIVLVGNCTDLKTDEEGMSKRRKYEI